MAVAVRAVLVGKALAQSKTYPGSVTVALGLAQFIAQSFFQLFKNCSNFVIQNCCIAEIQKCAKFACC
jgi:hypothetical protein